MRTTKLGTGGPEVSAIGMGCMFYGEVSQREVEAAVATALDEGITIFDTADVYEGGRSEEMLGRALAEAPSRALVATKMGIAGRNGDGTLRIDARPERVREACERSLERLGRGTIDLYYLHRVDSEVPIEETVGELARLREQGKIRHIGLSEVSAETLRRASAVAPIAAVQSEYSMWSRGVERAVLPACRELGVALVPYSPLGRGFLAGAVRSADDLPAGDMRRMIGERFEADNLAINRRWLEEVEAIAAGAECSVGQLALAWLLSRGDDIIPIPGSRRAERVRENAAAARVVLEPETRERLDALLDRADVAGLRYPTHMLAQLER